MQKTVVFFLSMVLGTILGLLILGTGLPGKALVFTLGITILACYLSVISRTAQKKELLIIIGFALGTICSVVHGKNVLEIKSLTTINYELDNKVNTLAINNKRLVDNNKMLLDKLEYSEEKYAILMSEYNLLNAHNKIPVQLNEKKNPQNKKIRNGYPSPQSSIP